MSAPTSSWRSPSCCKTSMSAICRRSCVRRSEERRVGKECRSRCDGSSDVCSSDLVAFLPRPNVSANLQLEITQLLQDLDVSHLQAELRSEIGRASCRERV